MRKAQRGQDGKFELNGVAYRLNDGSEIAIYLRRGAPWVAQFRGGSGELYTAGEWFRLHRPPRAPRLVHEAAAGSTSQLPEAVAARIEALHCRMETPVTPPGVSALLRGVRALLARLAPARCHRPDAARGALG